MKGKSLQALVFALLLNFSLLEVGNAQEQSDYHEQMCPNSEVNVSCVKSSGIVKKWDCSTPTNRAVHQNLYEAVRQACRQ